MLSQSLAWCQPLALAAHFPNEPLVLLHSGIRMRDSGRFSLLATGLIETRNIAHFSEMNPLLARGNTPFSNAWFGYLGYEMKHDCEDYTHATKGYFSLPRGRMMRFSHVYVFDHDQQQLTLWSDTPHTVPAPAMATASLPEVTSLASNMTRVEYETKAATILEQIHAGNLYQANLTRKFYGTWEHAPNGLALFARLCGESPAPYSAYLRMPEAEILSSSPELFLKMDTHGKLSTRPIKGSAPRGCTPEEDTRLRNILQESSKNRAENLMITDLMRHDLSRSCHPGSIQVADMFDVTTHATIHHMASTVSGQLAEGKTIIDALQGSFPPGSMTGAPKIRAVELCAALEGVERGVYSGAIGWLGGDGSAEFSVVIRTLIMHGKDFEFQVGGGIVADSTPESEWQETMDKAMGILRALGIPRIGLEAL